VFSELCVFGPSLQRAQRMPGPAEQALQDMAREFDLWLVPGSMYENRDGRIYNTTPVINPDGEVIARYRKMFPFAPLEEGVAPGDEFCVFDVPDVGRFAVLNCYDLWFPETARTVTSMGAEVILHPVMTHTIDRDVDLNVAKASAAMFQCYLFDINGLEAGGNGQSCVLDPSGRVIHQCGTTEELVPIEIDLEQVRRQRVRGMRTLGQPMKSFRDNKVRFPIYDPDHADLHYLASLGPLAKPQRVRQGEEPDPIEAVAAE
jgi:predicted amidohydrolase